MCKNKTLRFVWCFFLETDYNETRKRGAGHGTRENW